MFETRVDPAKIRRSTSETFPTTGYGHAQSRPEAAAKIKDVLQLPRRARAAEFRRSNASSRSPTRRTGTSSGKIDATGVKYTCK